MKHFSRIAAMLLAILVLCTGCGSSVTPDKYNSTAAATYGDQTTYLDEANFWLRLNQWGTESYTGMLYSYYYGISNIWPISSGVRTQTFEQTLKENTMAEILQTYVLLDHAEEYKAALTDDDNAKIDQLIEDLRNEYADEFFTLAGVAAGEDGDKQMRTYFEKRVMAYKVALAIMDAAEITVNEEDCKSFRIAYLLVPEEKKETESTAESTAAAETASPEAASSENLAGEALANVIRTNLTAGKTWEETKEAWKDLTSSEAVYAYSATDTTTLFYTEGKEMKTGDSKVSYKEGTGWYVLYCVSDDDAEGAKAEMDRLTAEKRAEAFNEAYKPLQDAAKAFKVSKAFTALTVEPAYVMKTTPAPETTEAASTEAASTEAASTEAASTETAVDK